MLSFKILIADSHTLTREGTKSLLTSKKDFNIVGEAMDSEELFVLIPKTNPDILIIDFNIPEHFSINDIASVREKYPQISILVITTNTYKTDIVNVLNHGIYAYILKDCEEEEVIQAIYASAKKEKFFCKRVINAVLKKEIQPNNTENNCLPISLSDRELEIIKHIADGYTTKCIALKLFLSFHTVNTHRKNIFKKLNVHSSSELILYAINQGIVNT
ncbi:response regulator transcription factor [Formosa sp. L2A11]|uniref:LuxR C-terminal-related transcriptional regulator n=1 Tax=Formosa sp. L2A11 TaxID=2686363 RepID=UPI00131C8318|nr:response regulator transcription factor [Formosa sp. L2A11]